MHTRTSVPRTPLPTSARRSGEGRPAPEKGKQNNRTTDCICKCLKRNIARSKVSLRAQRRMAPNAHALHQGTIPEVYVALFLFLRQENSRSIQPAVLKRLASEMKLRSSELFCAFPNTVHVQSTIKYGKCELSIVQKSSAAWLAVFLIVVGIAWYTVGSEGCPDSQDTRRTSQIGSF